MAVNPTSTVSGTSIDVTSVVSQLMEAEKKPLTALQTKKADAGLKISVLGEFKGLLSQVQDAVKALQTPQNFSATSASFSKPGVASATLNSLAQEASYRMSVTSLAKKNIWNVSGFATEQAAQAWYDHADQAAIKTSADRTILKNADGVFVLSLTAKSSGVSGGFAVPSPGGGLVAAEFQEPQDAEFTLNGVAFASSSNSVSDVLSGVTLNLEATTDAPITFTVGQAALSAKPRLEALVTAYNNLWTYYKAATQSSVDPASRGVLNSDFALRSAMQDVTSSLGLTLTDSLGTALGGQNDLSALGLELNQDGKLVLSDTLLSRATGLQTRLAQGLRIGYNGGKDLVNRIDDMLIPGGTIFERLESEKDKQEDINDRVERLQEKLVSVEARYKAQYAALNALLYDLSNTSTALKSALDGLTASQRD